MAKTAAQLIATVRARAGRSRDTVLITAAFVLDALNEAQLQISRRSPNLSDLQVIDDSTYTLATDQTTLDLSTIGPAHISQIWILDSTDTRQEGITFMERTQFFRKYIIVTDETAAEPIYWTRVGNTLYFNCPIASDYNGLSLRIDYSKYATPFPTAAGSETSDLKDADRGLIYFALAEVFDEIALTNTRLETKALKTRSMFEAWLLDYQDYNNLKVEEPDDGIPAI